MSIIINDPGCTTYGGNTGTPSCALKPKNIVGAMLIDKDKIFTEATVAAWITAAQGLCTAAAGIRVYPIFPFEGFTDGTDEPTYKTLGYGSEELAKEGKYKFTFDLVKGGLNWQNQLRLFNQDHSKKIIYFTADQKVYAVKATGGFTGFTLDYFHALPIKLDDGGDNPASFKLKVCHPKVDEFNKDAYIFDLGADPESTFKGILDVELSLISQEAGKVVVGVKSVTDQVNLYDYFSTLLADPNAWTLTKAGVAVTINAVVAKPLVSGWELATTTPSGAHLVNLVTPAALDALGVGGAPDEGYESTGAITVTW